MNTYFIHHGDFHELRTVKEKQKGGNADRSTAPHFHGESTTWSWGISSALLEPKPNHLIRLTYFSKPGRLLITDLSRSTGSPLNSTNFSEEDA